MINYDDSDGWYDHVAPTILNGSTDATNDAAVCTAAAGKVGVAGGYLDRCGPSQRLPFLVVSPFAKQNVVDHTPIEQTSITKFIEDNWSTGRIGDSSFDARAGSLAGMLDFAHPQAREVLLDSTTGAVAKIVPTTTTSTPTPTATATAGTGTGGTGPGPAVPVPAPAARPAPAAPRGPGPPAPRPPRPPGRRSSPTRVARPADSPSPDRR